MPETILFQQSYEGFRRLPVNEGDKELFFNRVYNWTKAGHPFRPVQQKFLTYVISHKAVDYSTGVPVTFFEKKRTNARNGIGSLGDYSHETRFDNVKSVFNVKKGLAVKLRDDSTSFTYFENENDIELTKRLAGSNQYKGREGVEIYPQELFLLEVDESKPERNKKVYATNIQNSRSKHKVSQQTVLIEKNYLCPLVKGVQIERFGLKPSNIVVPFPYNDGSRSPVSLRELSTNSPELMRYFNKNKGYFESQTKYNARIIGSKHATEFYSLARVGEYSYADYFVAFRDNTKWGATVVSKLRTPWGENKRPVFQNHAVTITQRPDGSYISEAEAHYICAYFNSEIVSNYILRSSDSRSFKINPPINLDLFDPSDGRHLELSKLSKTAHELYIRRSQGEQVEAEEQATLESINDIVKKLLIAD